MKAGFVALVGRPNAGKSTLVNRFVGQKVAIVSDKPQTTRHRIVGVRNADGAQMVFVDTPGIHKPLHRMNQRMVDTATDALRDADVVVLVVDATGDPGGGDNFVVEMLTRANVKPIVALNKIDRVSKSKLLPLIAHYAIALSSPSIVPLSALDGEGVNTLESEIVQALPEGDALFPEDYLTDQTERTLAAELVREKVLRHTHDELPYTTAVIMLEGRVHLDLHVKVRGDWRDNTRLLDEMGLRGR
jgi:GTP-binding protein Era